jgi:hypothetical protein
VEIYAGWQGTKVVVDLIIGIVSFVVGFLATLLLYLYDKKKNQAKETK